MDFYKGTQLARGRDAALLIDYSESRGQILARVDAGGEIWSSAKAVWTDTGLNLIWACLGERESKQEFAGLWHEISLRHFAGAGDNVVHRGVDMCMLALFYLCQPEPKTQIAMNVLTLKCVNEHLSKDLPTTRDLVKLLYHKKAFLPTYLTGMRTRCISNSGQVIKLMEQDSETNLIISKANSAIIGSELLASLVDTKQSYLASKTQLIKHFVENDTEELIDFDEDIGLVTKKLKEDLSKVTSLSIDYAKVLVEQLGK